MQNKYLMVQVWYNKRTDKAQNKQIKTDYKDMDRIWIE